MDRPRVSWRWRPLVLLMAGLILAAGVSVGALAQEASGFGGYIQQGTCEQPAADAPFVIDLVKSGGVAHAIEPYLVQTAGGEDAPLGDLFYGVAEVPGFGALTLLDNKPFSLVITAGDSGEIVSCGSIDIPAGESFRASGTLLVRLVPQGGSSVAGAAIFEEAPAADARNVTKVRVLLLADATATTAATPRATPSA